MEIEEWWPNLSAWAEEWLVANNGDAVPPSVLDAIVAAGGAVGTDARWVGDSGPDGFFLSDEASDWIEAVANDEG